MAFSYSAYDIMAPIAKAKQQIEALKNDTRLDTTFRAGEIARLQREANTAALAAYRAKMRDIRDDVDRARKDVYAALMAQEKSANWPRLRYLRDVVTAWAASADSWDALNASFEQAVDARDTESLRVWYDSLPTIREASRRLPEFIQKWPRLESAIKRAFEDVEPLPIKEKRGELAEFTQAASDFENEAGTLSFTSWGGEDARAGFLQDLPSPIFGIGG